MKMATDYKKQWESFRALPFDERKESVIKILEAFRGKDEAFDIIHQYVTQSDRVTDQDLQDVYDSMVASLYQLDSEAASEAELRFKEIQNKAASFREAEQKENVETASEAELLLTNL